MNSRLNYETVDLSIGFYTEMPKYYAEWFPKFAYSEIAPDSMKDANFKRRFTRMDLFVHNATHVETSDHVFSDGNTIGVQCLEKFIGFPVIIDLTNIQNKSPIHVSDIIGAISNRSIREESIILIKTTYNDKKWGTESFWDESPWLTEEAASYISSFKPKLVGIDFQTEKPKEKEFVVHKALTKNKAVICEYLINLDKMTENHLFMAVPVKTPELEASPVRALGIKFGNSNG